MQQTFFQAAREQIEAVVNNYKTAAGVIFLCGLVVGCAF